MSGIHQMLLGNSSAVPSVFTSPTQVRDYGLPSGVYSINPNVTGWNTPKSCWVDTTRNGGGWALWVSKYSTAAMEIRSYWTGYSDATYDLTDRTDPSITGHQSYMWSILNGSTELWWVNNITGQSASSAGSYNTSVLHVAENGTAMNSDENFWNLDAGTTSCPVATRRYDYSVTSVDGGWFNGHPSSNYACSGWGHLGNQYVGNYTAAGDYFAGYSPISRLFGNGNSGYYPYGNTYDYDYLWFDGSSLFNDVKIASHAPDSNQVWLRW